MYRYQNKNKKLVEWCPICGNTFEYETNGDADYSDTLATFWCCDELMIDLDIEIAEPVIRLNKKGYITRFSCSGHSIDGYGYILFKSDDEIVKNNLYSSLNGLKLIYHDTSDYMTCIRFKPLGINYEKTKKGNIYTKKNFNLYLNELLKEFDILIERLPDLSHYYSVDICSNGYGPSFD